MPSLRAGKASADAEFRRLVEMKKSFYRESKGGVRSYTGPLDATFYPGTLDEVLKKFGW
jgi:hypothetical protein